MKIILVPGLWLDADSWGAVTPALAAAGHTPVPLTMPGVGAPASASSRIGITDWIDAVVAEIDRADAPVVLVGHSGGGNVVWGATDRRPERVAHVVLVDTTPPAPGGIISMFPILEGVIPFPGWEFFDDPDIFDLDDETRERAEGAARSVPEHVPTDEIELGDRRRHAVPVTVLSGSADQDQWESMLAEWPEYAGEFAAISDRRVVPLGSGHWPQFSRAEVLAREILAAVAMAEEHAGQ